MKRVAFVLALLGAVFVCLYGIAQSVSQPEPVAGSNSLFEPFIPAPPPTPAQWSSPLLFGPNAVTQTNFLPSVPKHRPIAPPRIFLFDSPPSASNARSNALPPGVYNTEPYTSLVLVPGPHPDDKCIIGNGAAQPPIRMPTVKPDLQFIPRKPAQPSQ